jgi:hypothetical protein
VLFGKGDIGLALLRILLRQCQAMKFQFPPVSICLREHGEFYGIGQIDRACKCDH